MYCRMGAGQIPKSSISHPDASRAEMAADWSIGPEILVSLPNRTFREFIKVPKALAKSITSSGVIVSPTIPLTPEMPILRSFIVIAILVLSNYIQIFHDRKEDSIFVDNTLNCFISCQLEGNNHPNSKVRISWKEGIF